MAWTLVPIVRTFASLTESSRRLWSLPVPDGSIGYLSRKIIAVGIPSLTLSESTDLWDLIGKPSTSVSTGVDSYFPSTYEYWPTGTLGRYFAIGYWGAGGTNVTTWSVASKDTETWSLVSKPA